MVHPLVISIPLNFCELIWARFSKELSPLSLHCSPYKLMDDERGWELQLFMPRGELLTTDTSKIWPMFLMSEY